MPDRWRMTLGDAMELCYVDALDDWRRLYARSTRVEELLAGPLRKVEVRVNVYPGGRAGVTVACIGRRHLQDEAYYTELHRDAGLWMIGETSTTYSSR